MQKTYDIVNLKQGNFLMGLKTLLGLEGNFLRKQTEHPMPRKIVDGYSVPLLQNDFERLKSIRLLPKIAGFGLA